MPLRSTAAPEHKRRVYYKIVVPPELYPGKGIFLSFEGFSLKLFEIDPIKKLGPPSKRP